jgi:2-oxoglutarate ferredoxin oxidoreductase subunit beta
LKKLENDYDPTNKMLAYQTLENARRENKFLTGLFYINVNEPSMTELLEMVDQPLSHLSDSQIRPTRESLRQIMADL